MKNKRFNWSSQKAYQKIETKPCPLKTSFVMMFFNPKPIWKMTDTFQIRDIDNYLISKNWQKKIAKQKKKLSQKCLEN